MKKTTKRALFLSFASMFLCFTMLLGTTYAWFTDSVESGVNQIVAGNLDVELTHINKNMAQEATVKDATDLFKLDDDQKWEPGAMVWENFTVKNVGDLALKYQLTISAFNASPAKNNKTLADALQVAVVEGGVATDATRDSLKDKDYQPLATFSVDGELVAGTANNPTTKTYGIVIWWEPSDNDNDFNMNNDNDTTPLTIDLGVKLFATQLEAESDSFGSDYDAGAPWTGSASTDWYTAAPDGTTEYTINSAEDLAGLAAIVNGTAESPVTTLSTNGSNLIHDDFANKTIKLKGDIDLNGIDWTPIGRIGTTSTDFTYAFRGTFDGQGHTIYGLDASGEGWVGLIGIAYKATIKNVKLDGVTLTGNRMTGSVVGQLYGSIDNCHVKNANILVVPNAVGDSYDNGDKVGGIVGWIGDNGNNHSLTNCSATTVKLGAYRDVGGIAGYVASSTIVSGNSATGVTITVDQTSNFYGEKDTNAGAIIGRDNGAVVDDTNTTTDFTVTETYYKDGITLREGSELEGVTLYLVPSDYDETTITVPAGVTTIGGYAFAYNTKIEEIILPSTVTTLNDRAFRDTSASKVVLNEGLENISYQAFRNALNVTEVVIPSTVKTISKEAFQNSGVTTLTIPANVTTIEYGGLRDMKVLETVVIEGNVDIPVYAFRACTNLRTVILKGDDVTFGGGSRGMIFTNKENGDGSAITVLVANETVKERLLAADTAAKDYGGYTIIVGTDITPVASAEALADALTAGGKILLTSDINATAGIVLPEGATIDGNGHTITYSGTEYDYHLVKLNTNATIKNVTLENYRVRTEETTNGVVTLNNVVINMDNDLTGLDISRGTGTAKLTKVTCKSITDATHLDPSTTVQVDYTPYGDVLLGTKWALEATNCTFGSLHGWNTTNGSNVSLNDTTYTVFRMHYWSNRTLYVNGVETAWSESGAIPVAHDVGGCWSVQPEFK